RAPRTCQQSFLYSLHCHSTINYYSKCFFIFFIQHPATTEIYTLSLHDALPIYEGAAEEREPVQHEAAGQDRARLAGEILIAPEIDRKSTRLNSSHEWISYAVFCLKKKKK